MNSFDEVTGLFIGQFNSCKFGLMCVFHLLNNIHKQYMIAVLVPLKLRNISINFLGV